MKILLLADTHFTSTNPENRIDDFTTAQFDKMDFILNFAKESAINYILHGGDVFNSFKEPHSVVQNYVGLLKHYHTKFIGVYGQHDFQYHGETENTPLKVLEKAGLFIRANSKPIPYENIFPSLSNCPNIDIYGCSYNALIPNVMDKGKLNILIIHSMIVNDKLWKSQEHFTYGLRLLRTTDFNLIVSGDNHQCFILNKFDKWLVNCGSLMRSKSDQIGHEPRFHVYDTERNTVQSILIPIEPAEKVFAINKIETEKKTSATMDAFITGLKGDTVIEGLNYVENIHQQTKKTEYKELNETVNEILGEC